MKTAQVAKSLVQAVSADYWLSSVSDGLSDAQKRLCAWVINQFGTGAHAWAEPRNLGCFSTDYVLGCIDNAIPEHRGLSAFGLRRQRLVFLRSTIVNCRK